MSPESTSPSGQALPAGTRLEEFEIESVLGRGGFGITYLARDTSLGRQVVIKENLPAMFAYRETTSGTVQPQSETGEDADNFRWSMQNFLREADTLASLDHPGIVSVLRKFETNGTAYFVMPHVEGLAFDTLESSRQEKGQWFTEDELRGLLEHVLDALGYLHARGIYHRDIKPGNILITMEGVPILIDFGSARQRLSERSMTVVESAGYTPFEQLQSRGNVGPWSDLYSLGATVAKAITGEAPPKAADRVYDDPWVPLAGRKDLRGHYSGELLESIDRALEPQVSPRFQEAGEWLGALQGEQLRSEEEESVPPVPEAESRSSSEEVEDARGGGKRKGLLIAVGAAAVLVIVGVGTVLTGNMREEEERVRLAQEEKLVAVAALKNAEAELAARKKAEAELAARKKAEAELAAQKKATAAEAARMKAEEELAAQKKAEEERKRREAVITKALELVVPGKKFTPDFFAHVDREVLSSAAEGGDPRAQYVWGKLHESPLGLLNDDEEAVKWLRKAAEQGDADAQNALGVAYALGRGVVERDEVKSAEWFRKAAEQGYADAQNALGVAYALGRGVEKDAAEAVKWYRKAAAQGDAYAQYNLGVMYYNGSGVAKDDVEAVKWYRKAAAQGDTDAKAALRELGVRE